MWFWIFFFINAMTSQAQAAPCCSSTSAAPALITGDDRIQLGWVSATSHVVADAPIEGLPTFRNGTLSESTESHRLDAAFVFTDRLQAGSQIGIVNRKIRTPGHSSNATHLGDAKFNLGYEFLPEWNYSYWRPKGLGFLQVTAPSGRTIYDARDPLQSDATSTGFYRLSAGALFTKKWSLWDAYFLSEVHRGWSRSFSSINETIRVTPGWGASWSMGWGLSPGGGNLRIGLRVQPTWEQSKKISTATSELRSHSQKAIDTSIEFAYLVQEEWSILSAYTDQTLLGPAKNVALSRSFSVGLQKRWAR